MEEIQLDSAQSERLATLPPDGITQFTLEGDTIRGALVNGTALVSLMRSAHGLGILETLILGKAYLAASLLSVTLKGQDKLSLRAEGSGPAKGFVVDCDSGGNVRGRLFVPAIELDSPPESLDTAPLLGSGFLSLARYPEGKTEAVTGTAAMKSGRLAEDLAYFYHISEQTRTSFSLGVHFAKDGQVDGAGGLFLQALPGASDEALDRVERLVYGMHPLGETFASGAGRMDVALRSFPFFDLNLHGDKPTRFFCSCNKGRISNFVSALAQPELDDMAEHGPFPLEVSCHNCGSRYTFSQKELRFMADRSRAERQKQAEG